MANNANLQHRIDRARAAIRHADQCELEARSFPADLRAMIGADAEAVRASANDVLKALLADFDGAEN